MKKHIIVIIVCLLLTLASCGTKSSEVTQDSVAVTDELQLQINDLNSKLVAYNSAINQLQTQVKTTKPVTTSAATKQMQIDIEALASTFTTLTASVDALQAQITALQETSPQITALQSQVTELQQGLRAASTTIGTSSISVNGLSVVFINNRIDIPATGPETPNSAQFAIKIINTTDKVLNNIDVTGTITCSPYFFGLAAGYPKIVDANTLCNYAFSGSGSSVLCFEAYSSGKASLTIPVGGSITIRPKITVLATEDSLLPPMNLIISLNTITYDITEPTTR